MLESGKHRGQRQTGMTERGGARTKHWKVAADRPAQSTSQVHLLNQVSIAYYLSCWYGKRGKVMVGPGDLDRQRESGPESHSWCSGEKGKVDDVV